MAATSSCGLVQVNGKPLGGSSGGGGAPPSSSPNTGGGTTSGGGETASTGAQLPSSAPPPPGQAPAWCEDTGTPVVRSDRSFDDVKDVELQREASPRSYYSAAKFADALCTTGRIADRDKILALKAKWMQVNEIDEGEFVVLVGLRHMHTYDNQDLDKLPGPTSQLGEYRYAAGALVAADRLGNKLTMLGRFLVVNACVNNADGSGLLLEVLCTRDQLDVPKAYAEIDSVQEINLGTRRYLREKVREAAAWHAKTRAALDAKAKEDPGIAKVIAIADATFKEWASPSAKRSKLLELVARMEAATASNKRSAFKGCDAEARGAWEAHLASLSLPKVPSKRTLVTFLEATLDKPEGYLAFNALRLCSAGSEENFYKGLEYLGSDVTFRGPRTATIAAWLAAAGDIKFDDRAMKMEREFRGLPKQEGTRWQDARQGQIDKITPFDGGVEISFKRVLDTREDCVQSVATNRISSIDTNGNVYYRQKCLKWGMVKVDVTADPIKIGATMAAGLRPGMYLYAQEGLAIAATMNAKSSTPIWVLGGSVKK